MNCLSGPAKGLVRSTSWRMDTNASRLRDHDGRSMHELMALMLGRQTCAVNMTFKA